VVRYGMEVQRLCSVLENQLKDGRTYILGDEYTIADMAILPWFQAIKGGGYRHANGVRAKEFLSVTENYPNACRWAEMLMARPQVKRGMIVCLGDAHDDRANLIDGQRGAGKPWLEVEKYKWLAKL